MARLALAVATLSMLLLNGSMAAASQPVCGEVRSVCAISLRMFAPPPARPATLAAPGELAIVLPVAERR